MNELHIPDAKVFEEKLNKIKAGGLSKLHIVADFDGTLTGQSADGKLPSTSWSIFKSELGDEYANARKALFDEYHPIERNSTLDIGYRREQMSLWWKKHLQLLIDSKVSLQEINKVLMDQNLKLRGGVSDLLSIAAENNIPFLIFSAGIGDAIKEYLEMMNLKTENLHIISNFFKFNPNGEVAGFQNEVVHTLNKTESLVKTEPYSDKIIDKPNCILLGDSLHDASMTDGISHSVVLKIGFLNGRMAEKESFGRAYDAVLEKDTDISYINELIFN